MSETAYQFTVLAMHSTPEEAKLALPRSPLPSEIIVICGLGLLAALTLILWTQELESRGAILINEISQLSPAAEQSKGRLATVKKVRARYERFLSQAAAVTANEALTGFAPALRVLATSGGDGIVLRDAAVAPAEAPQTWTLQLQGAASGPVPRAVADHYLQSLERELSQRYSIVQPCRFAGLEEESVASAFRGVPRRATFAIEAKLMVQSSGGSEPH